MALVEHVFARRLRTGNDPGQIRIGVRIGVRVRVLTRGVATRCALGTALFPRLGAFFLLELALPLRKGESSYGHGPADYQTGRSEARKEARSNITGSWPQTTVTSVRLWGSRRIRDARVGSTVPARGDS